MKQNENKAKITRRINLFFICSLIISINIYSQKLKSQKVKLFGEKIKAKEITGLNKFNDLGTLKNTSVINDLTDDLNTFLWRIGTVRIDKYNYRKGVFSLFDLSNYDNSKGYPTLELIDFKYYEEVGFILLEKQDSTLIYDTKYLAFKKSFKQGKGDAKRKLLWLDSNYEIREKLINSKYYINIQQISSKVTKKLTTNISDSLKVNFSKVINKIPIEKLSDNTKAELENYLNIKNQKNQDLLLNGEYISAIFNTRYISIVNFIIGGLKQSDLDKYNEFDNRLIQYIENINSDIDSDKESKFGLNSAVYGFRFSGNYNLIKIDSLELKGKLNISLETSVEISNSLNYEIKKSYNRTFKNEFNKLWIIMFGTDGVLNKLKLNDRAIIRN